VIWHLLPQRLWRSADGVVYVPGTEATAPFVHTSPDLATLLAVANLKFREADEPMVALGVDPAKLTAPLRYEPADPAPPPGVSAETLFPHIYGPIETAAVTEVRYARRDATGAYASFDPAGPGKLP
jgi:uncharacterized protein (DUF952 family)